MAAGMKKVYWLLGIALLVLGLWFVQGERSQPSGELVRVWKGWRGVANRDEFALAKDFLAARGIKLKVEAVGKLPLASDATDEALLLSGFASLDTADKAALEELRLWVENGGHLLILGHEAAATHFGFLLADTLDKAEEQPLYWQVDDLGIQVLVSYVQELRPQHKAGKGDKKREGAVKPLAVLKNPNNYKQIFGLQQRLGKGKITVLGHNQALWHNHSNLHKGEQIAEGKEYVPLARADNAAYLHALLQGHSKARLIIETQVLRQRGFADFQWRLPEPHWWPALAVTFLGLIAAAWRFGKRFGPLLMPKVAVERDMAQHLLAAGQFWARQREVGYLRLAEQMRRRLQADLAARHYVEEDYPRLAARSGVSKREMDWLFRGALPVDAPAFGQFVRVAERLRAALKEMR